MYSWGLNTDSLLGHGRLAEGASSLSHPRPIDALAGQHISQVSQDIIQVLVDSRWIQVNSRTSSGLPEIAALHRLCGLHRGQANGKGSVLKSQMTRERWHTDQCDLKNLACEEVSGGAAHSLFTGQQGQLWGCGSNAERQLAQEDADEAGGAPVPRRLLQSAGRAVRFAVAAGHHSLAVLEKQPRSHRQLRRSMSECRLAPC